MPLLVHPAMAWMAVSVRGELGDRIVTAMPTDLPAPDAPVVSVAGAIARMEAIAAALPAADGLACFNRMYLDVTRQVNSQLGQGFYADPAFMTQLDVAFANLYFAAADTASTPAAVPLAWRPLVERRAVARIDDHRMDHPHHHRVRHLRRGKEQQQQRWQLTGGVPVWLLLQHRVPAVRGRLSYVRRPVPRLRTAACQP
jgi:hypothetical protein